MSAEENLRIWNALFRTDPAHVKPITGKTYQGNSPKPQYVIWRLTEQFGPVGCGFGWYVLSDDYIDGKPHQDGTEKLHECRVRFWWKADGERCEMESYGCTKALYKTKQGYWVDDEDAAKKSLTDAIVKAASWLGVAGDIFMGRWDDSKYQQELREEMRAERAAKAAQRTVEPPHDPLTGEIEMPPSAPSEGAHGASIRDAWEDGIRDSLPQDHTERDFFIAGCKSLKAQFSSYKDPKWLLAAWTKYGGFLSRLHAFDAKLFEALEAHYQECERALAEKPATPKLSRAAGEALLAGISKCDTIDLLETFMSALARGPNAYAAEHPKIVAAYKEQHAAIIEANPAEGVGQPTTPLDYFQKWRKGGVIIDGAK